MAMPQPLATRQLSISCGISCGTSCRKAADKYCGGLMGWMWDGTIPCRALDSPCDPAKESCSGK